MGQLAHRDSLQGAERIPDATTAACRDLWDASHVGNLGLTISESMRFRSVLDGLTHLDHAHILPLPAPVPEESAAHVCEFDLVEDGPWAMIRAEKAACRRGRIKREERYRLRVKPVY
jgi:hypothetical protein